MVRFSFCILLEFSLGMLLLGIFFFAFVFIWLLFPPILSLVRKEMQGAVVSFLLPELIVVADRDSRDGKADKTAFYFLLFRRD
jgi:hypothetical protein